MNLNISSDTIFTAIFHCGFEESLLKSNLKLNEKAKNMNIETVEDLFQSFTHVMNDSEIPYLIVLATLTFPETVETEFYGESSTHYSPIFEELLNCPDIDNSIIRNHICVLDITLGEMHMMANIFTDGKIFPPTNNCSIEIKTLESGRHFIIVDFTD